MGGNATYGFILYYDLMSAITAKQYMDGHNLKGNNIRVRARIMKRCFAYICTVLKTPWRIPLYVHVVCYFSGKESFLLSTSH